MMRRLSFIPLIFILSGMLSAWYSRIQAQADLPSLSRSQISNLQAGDRLPRAALIQTLNEIVEQERVYRSKHGHYTRFLNRVGAAIPETIRSSYEVRVVDSSDDELLVSAFAEVGGHTTDFISMDQNHQMRANFPLSSYSMYAAAEASQASDATEKLRSPASGSEPGNKPLEIEPIDTDL